MAPPMQPNIFLIQRKKNASYYGGLALIHSYHLILWKNVNLVDVNKYALNNAWLSTAR